MPLLLLAQDGRSVLRNAAWAAWPHDARTRLEFTAAFPVTAWLPAVAWLVVAVAARRGWRVVAAVAAWCAVLGQGAALYAQYRVDPVYTHSLVGLVVLGVTAAAALSVPAAAGRGARVVDRRGYRLFLAGCALVLLSSAVNLLLAAGPGWTGGPGALNLTRGGPVYLQAGPATVPMYVAAAALMVAAVAASGAPVSRLLVRGRELSLAGPGR